MSTTDKLAKLKSTINNEATIDLKQTDIEDFTKEYALKEFALTLKKNKNKYRATSINLPLDTLHKLNKLKKESSMNLTEIINMIIDDFFTSKGM